MAELTYVKHQSRQRKPGIVAKARAKKRRALEKLAKTIRAAVVERAEGRCERCDFPVGDYGHAHHRIPRSRCGKWTMSNIQYLCQSCHAKAHKENKL